MNAPTTSANDARAALRRQMKATRQAWLQSGRAAQAQEALHDRLLDVLQQLEPQTLGLYWPLPGEFNPKAAAGWAQKDLQCELLLPWAGRDPRLMHYRPWNGQNPDGVDECGIPSPASAPVKEWLPDVVLVPCLGFTADGYRLGYGGGYFDRYLAAHPSVTAIGVAWACSEMDPNVFSAQLHDVALAGIVTER